MYLATPCVIITSYIRKFSVLLLGDLLISLGISFLIHIIGIVVAALVFPAKNRTDKSAVMHYAIVFSNAGYMGIPVISDVLGEECAIYATFYVVWFNIFCYSLGRLMYTEDKYGDRDEYKCDGKREFDKPLVVLVDGNSASASEVLAGAIKDYEIGTLVGTTTFGKGIVQQIISVGDGSAVKVTVSSYYSPKGINIHGIGIEPDIVCEFDAEAYYGEEEFDNQLEYAKEVLSDMID